MAILRERALSTALFAKLPVIEEVDRGFRECCYEHIVFGDNSSSKDERNDYSLSYFQRLSTVDTCDFVLVKLSDMSEYPLNDGTYGEFKDFGDYTDCPNLTTYIVEWKNVLLAHGQGQFRIRKDFTVAGLTFSESSYAYSVYQFSSRMADNTFRMDVVMSGYLEREGVSFKNANVRHSIRSRGFFGNVKPEYTIDALVYKNKNSDTPVFMNIKDVYVLQTEPLPICITKEFRNFMMLAPKKWFSDFNANNHDYELTKIEVRFDGASDPDYWSTSRDSRLNYTFSERYLNNNYRSC